MTARKKIIRRSTNSIELAGATVPSIYLRPDGTGPFPGVLLLHGYSSSKQRLSDTMGRSLAVRGIASLAIDLPLHGARDDAFIEDARSNPMGVMRLWKMALNEARAAVKWLAQQPEIDPQRVSVAGYSLGSYIGLQTAAAEKSVASVIVAAGGDLPSTRWTSMARMVVDPVKAVRSLRGRPLLMLHGKFDRTISADQAQRLYDAAMEPKELRWYNSGHVLPPAAADDAAAWL